MEKQTLGEKTAQMLLEMIQKEGFGPGDKLPTEAELVESLGCLLYTSDAADEL